jgi:hypothetical protein
MELHIPVHNQHRLPCTSFSQTFTTSSPCISCAKRLIAQRTYSIKVSYKLAPPKHAHGFHENQSLITKTSFCCGKSVRTFQKKLQALIIYYFFSIIPQSFLGANVSEQVAQPYSRKNASIFSALDLLQVCQLFFFHRQQFASLHP